MNFKTNLLLVKKGKERKGFVYENSRFGLEKSPIRPLVVVI